MIQVIQKSKFKKMPWKNGKGQTTEILIDPLGVDFSSNHFHFRFSSAPIIQDGEFSLFPKMQRILIPIKGAGFQLNDDVFEKFEVAHFAGDNKIFCRLLKGPVVDFGIIFDPSLVDIKVKILHLKSRLQFSVENDKEYFVTVLDGAIIRDHETLEPLETIRFENESLCQLQVLKSAVVCVATIAKK